VQLNSVLAFIIHYQFITIHNIHRDIVQSQQTG